MIAMTRPAHIANTPIQSRSRGTSPGPGVDATSGRCGTPAAPRWRANRTRNVETSVIAQSWVYTLNDTTGEPSTVSIYRKSRFMAIIQHPLRDQAARFRSGNRSDRLIQTRQL